jgi:uncharacterized membrane protein HdeD (DUF308 family)
MLATAARQWWVLVLQGVLAIVFGVFALLNPGITIVSLALLFGAWALISGVSEIVEGWRVAEHRGRSWPFALSGIVSIVAGVIAIVLPPAAIGGLLLLLAAWLIVSGISEAYVAYRIREQIDNEWILALAGIVRAVLGVVVFVAPIVGVIVVVATVGWVAIVGGLMAIGLGLRLRRLHAGAMGGGMRGSAAA